MVLGPQGPGRVGRRRFLLTSRLRAARSSVERLVLPVALSTRVTGARHARRTRAPSRNGATCASPATAVVDRAALSAPVPTYVPRERARPTGPTSDPNSTRAARSCGGPRGGGSPSGAPVLPDRGAGRLRCRAPGDETGVRQTCARGRTVPLRRACADDGAAGGAGARWWGRSAARARAGAGWGAGACDAAGPRVASPSVANSSAVPTASRTSSRSERCGSACRQRGEHVFVKVGGGRTERVPRIARRDPDLALARGNRGADLQPSCRRAPRSASRTRSRSLHTAAPGAGIGSSHRSRAAEGRRNVADRRSAMQPSRAARARRGRRLLTGARVRRSRRKRSAPHDDGR